VTGRHPYWKWWVCGWLLLATMILYMDRLVLTQQALKIRAAFGIEHNDFYYGLLDSAFAVAFAFGALFAGWLADRWTVWLLYPILVVLWSLVGGVTGLIEGYWVLFICRFFLGLFEAGHWPCALKTTQRILAPAERTLGNGIMQSGAAIGSVITPLVLLWFALFTDSWRPAFLVVGGLGVLWASGWFLLVRREDVTPDPSADRDRGDSSGSWAEVFRDRRFWLMVAVVICINSTWHYFRVWMPVILNQLHGFDDHDVQVFSIAYYAAADLGSLATGFISVWLVGRGLSVHGSRLAVFGLCSIMATLSLVAILAPGNPVFLWVLPVVGFASLGLFPVYYSFTQELTVRNQGKVTGSLGFICWMVMAGLRALEGGVADLIKSEQGGVVERYAFGIILAGVMPIVAMLILIFFWPDSAPVAPTFPDEPPANEPVETAKTPTAVG
jgi:ACS family hexuronate transporter-like MFS transporter